MVTVMSHGYRYLIFALLLALLPTARCHAIEPNPTLAAQILLTKNKFQKALRNEEIAQGLMGEGHIAIGHEVHATNNLLHEFNNYLDSFKCVVAIAADLYGIYLDINRTTKLVGQVSSIVSSAPSNAIAVLLRPDENGLYGSVINTSLEAAQDIYNACISKKKLTEQDRDKMLNQARRKIKKVNADLARLVVVLKYTTFEDIWYSIRERSRFLPTDRKHAIIERCYNDWKYNRSRVRIN